MTNCPAQQSKTLRYLVRDLTRVSRFRALQAVPQDALFAGLRPVATLAAWICKFQPELAYESNLHVAVVGAEQEDTVDEGRWYGFLGYLLGNEKLYTRVTFVGPSLYRFSGNQPPLTPTGIWRTEAARTLAELGFQKANIQQVDAGTFAGMGEARDVSLLILFNPGLEDDHQYSWFKPGQLSALCALGKPLALTAYAEDEQLQEAYLLRAWGYTSRTETMLNPFIGMETPVGAWGQVLWSIKSGPVDANQQPDRKMLERNHWYMRVAESVIAESGMTILPSTGKLVPIQLRGGGSTEDTRAILLSRQADEGRLGVGVASGTLYCIHNGVAVFEPEMKGLEVPPEMLETYGVDAPYSFEHILWALDTLDWFALRYRDKQNAAYDSVDDFRGIDVAGMDHQLDVLKHDKTLMADPQMRELSDVLEGFSQMFGGLPAETQAMLGKGAAGFPSRKPFEPTKGAEVFFHVIELGDWTRASDLLQAHPEFGYALNREGANAAMAAASANNLDFLSQLAQSGTDFNVQDTELFSPLHEAARRGYTEAVDFLLAHGAHPDPVSRFGWTPLFMTLTGRMGNRPVSAYSQIVLTLLSHQADARRKNFAGMSVASVVDAVELSDAARQALKAACV